MLVQDAGIPIKYDDWKDRLQQAEKRIEQHYEAWENYIRQAGRSFYDVGAEGFGTNWMYPEARTAVANIYVRDPMWDAVNKNPEFQKSKRASESILSYLWSRFQWADVIRRALYTAWFIGFGPVKLDFVDAHGGLPNLQMTKERVKALEQILTDAGAGPNLDGLPALEIAEGVGQPVSDNPMALRGFPSLRDIDIRDFLIDTTPNQISIERAQWVGEKMWLPIEYVQQSPLYIESQRKRVEGQERTEMSKAGNSNDSVGSSCQKWVRIYEWYDKINGMLNTAVLEEDIVLRSVPFSGVIPYDMVTFNPLPTQFMPIPDASLVYPHAVEMDELKSRVSRILDRQRFQALYDEEMVRDEAALNGMLTGDDAAKIPVKVDPTGNKRLADAIHIPNPITVPQELYQYLGILREEIRMASGTSNVRAGGGREGRSTATEVRAREMGTNIRFADKTLALDHFLERIGNRALQLCRENWSPEMIATISGERDNDEAMRGYNEQVEAVLAVGGSIKDVPPVAARFLIRGEFIIRVKAGSTAPLDPMAELQRDNMLYQMMLASPVVDNMWAAKWFFPKHVPGVENAMPPEAHAGAMQGQGLFQSMAGPNDPMAQPQQPQAVLPQDEEEVY